MRLTNINRTIQYASPLDCICAKYCCYCGENPVDTQRFSVGFESLRLASFKVFLWLLTIFSASGFSCCSKSISTAPFNLLRVFFPVQQIFAFTALDQFSSSIRNRIIPNLLFQESAAHYSVFPFQTFHYFPPATAFCLFALFLGF